MAQTPPFSVVNDLLAAAPPGLALPPPIVETLRWLEGQGAARPFRTPAADGPPAFLTLYPADSGVPDELQSLTMIFRLPDFHYDWPGHDPAEIRARLFLFVRTGGDGSMAGLWRDDQGAVQFVHVGSGSGSVWWNVITDDPLAFLGFLAIGYSEPAFYEVHALPPVGTEPPRALQAWLAARLGQAVPTRATGLIATPADTDPTPDAFSRWLLRDR